jgi:hypothetical protein
MKKTKEKARSGQDMLRKGVATWLAQNPVFVEVEVTGAEPEDLVGPLATVGDQMDARKAKAPDARFKLVGFGSALSAEEAPEGDEAEGQEEAVTQPSIWEARGADKSAPQRLLKLLQALEKGLDKDINRWIEGDQEIRKAYYMLSDGMYGLLAAIKEKV